MRENSARRLFPQQIGLAAARCPELAETFARISAADSRAPGLRWTFARVLDVGRQPLWARFPETIDPAGPRACLGAMMKRLRRNKVLLPRHGLMLAAIDGHETHATSYKCRHEGCLEREINVGGRKVTQYYQRFTVFQIIGDGFHFLLDLEAQRPWEDEVTCAMRLIERVLAAHPRCFDVLTCDAIYLRPSMIGMLLAAGKHFVAVLKENQPDLLAEARLLLPVERAEHFSVPKAPGKSVRQVELRQADGFTTESIHTPLRVVHARETGTRNELVAGRKVKTPSTRIGIGPPPCPRPSVRAAPSSCWIRNRCRRITGLVGFG